MRKKLEGYGLVVSAFSARNDFLQPDPHSVKAEVERMRRICAITKILHEDAVVRSEGGVPKEEIPRKNGSMAFTSASRPAWGVRRGDAGGHRHR